MKSYADREDKIVPESQPDQPTSTVCDADGTMHRRESAS